MHPLYYRYMSFLWLKPEGSQTVVWILEFYWCTSNLYWWWLNWCVCFKVFAKTLQGIGILVSRVPKETKIPTSSLQYPFEASPEEGKWIWCSRNLDEWESMKSLCKQLCIFCLWLSWELYYEGCWILTHMAVWGDSTWSDLMQSRELPIYMRPRHWHLLGTSGYWAKSLEQEKRMVFCLLEAIRQASFRCRDNFKSC